MKHLLVLALLLGSGAAAGCRTARAAEVRDETIRLRVTGMTCAVLCPPKVQAALESVTGVRSATVDYDSRTATVVCAAGCSTEALVAALQKQGFGARTL